MHVTRLNPPLPLQASAPVDSHSMRKKQDDKDRVQPIGEDDAAREERRRRQAWLEASLEKLDEAGAPTEGDETYRATSAPSSQGEAVPQSARLNGEALAPEPQLSPFEDLLAGVKAEPSTEHPEVVVEPKPSLDELLGHILEKPEES